MERASALLGHGSIKVTEKHYSPWVRARQEQLEADVETSAGAERSSALGGFLMPGDRRASLCASRRRPLYAWFLWEHMRVAVWPSNVNVVVGSLWWWVLDQRKDFRWPKRGGRHGYPEKGRLLTS